MIISNNFSLCSLHAWLIRIFETNDMQIKCAYTGFLYYSGHMEMFIKEFLAGLNTYITSEHITNAMK